MEEFGVRFTVRDLNRFTLLQSLYAAVKHDKDAGQFRDPEEWVRMVPDEIKCRFSWPTPEQRRHWLGIRSSVITAVPEPSEQLAAVWDFYRVFEALEEGEYDMLGCELVGAGVGEMRIYPHAYPYGGVGPLIALAEAFGFTILGVNEYGKYQTREDLIDGAGGV